MVCITVINDGQLQLKAKKENCAVSQQLLLEILTWRLEGSTDEDVIVRLRERTVPSGYRYHTWQPGIIKFQQ